MYLSERHVVSALLSTTRMQKHLLACDTSAGRSLTSASFVVILILVIRKVGSLDAERVVGRYEYATISFNTQMSYIT